MARPTQVIETRRFDQEVQLSDDQGQVVQLDVATRHQLKLGGVYRLEISTDQLVTAIVAEQEYLVATNGVWWTVAHDVYVRHGVISQNVEFEFLAEHTDTLKVQLHFMRRVRRVQGHWRLIRTVRKSASFDHG